MSSFQNKMTSACRMVTAAGLLLAMVSGCGPAGDNVDALDITDETDTAEPMVLVFAYFKASGMDPGDGLHLAASHDGYTFEPLRDDALFLSRPDGMSFRDPSIVMGPDETFHMVWTATAKSIGYAASTDLVNWTTPRLIPVMEHEPDALNAWAPATEPSCGFPKDSYHKTELSNRSMAGRSQNPKALLDNLDISFF